MFLKTIDATLKAIAAAVVVGSALLAMSLFFWRDEHRPRVDIDVSVNVSSNCELAIDFSLTDEAWAPIKVVVVTAILYEPKFNRAVSGSRGAAVVARQNLRSEEDLRIGETYARTLFLSPPSEVAGKQYRLRVIAGATYDEFLKWDSLWGFWEKENDGNSEEKKQLWTYRTEKSVYFQNCGDG